MQLAPISLLLKRGAALRWPPFNSIGFGDFGPDRAGEAKFPQKVTVKKSSAQTHR